MRTREEGNRELTGKLGKILIISILLLIVSVLSYSQEFEGYVLAKGTARFDKRPIKDAVAYLYDNGNKIQTKNAVANGKSEFKLKLNKVYERF